MYWDAVYIVFLGDIVSLLRNAFNLFSRQFILKEDMDRKPNSQEMSRAINSVFQHIIDTTEKKQQKTSIHTWRVSRVEIELIYGFIVCFAYMISS